MSNVQLVAEIREGILVEAFISWWLACGLWQIEEAVFQVMVAVLLVGKGGENIV